MPCSGLSSAGPTPRSTTQHFPAPGGSQIFSQEDQKGRRVSGFTSPRAIFGTTPDSSGRFGLVKTKFNDASTRVIAACIEVHGELGPGLLEAIYEECLCDELRRVGLAFERQKSAAVIYKGRALEQHFRTDLIIEQHLLVEVKAVEALLPIHLAQALTYLRLCNLDAGLVVNFNAVTIRAGLRRVFRPPQSFFSSCEKIPFTRGLRSP